MLSDSGLPSDFGKVRIESKEGVVSVHPGPYRLSCFLTSYIYLLNEKKMNEP